MWILTILGGGRGSGRIKNIKFLHMEIEGMVPHVLAFSKWTNFTRSTHKLYIKTSKYLSHLVVCI